MVETEVAAMARSIWTGVISFGLVSVPVAIYPATHEQESFHQFEQGTSDRIRYHRVNERTGKEVDLTDIVKDADIGGGQYVMLDPDELDQIASGRSRSLDIHRFVDLADINPAYYQKSYYLEPGSDETTKTYVLLREAMAETNRAAIATLVMRGKEYLAARGARKTSTTPTPIASTSSSTPRSSATRSPARRSHRSPPASRTSWRSCGAALKPPASAAARPCRGRRRPHRRRRRLPVSQRARASRT
ncbi:Ku protein [Dactylosporangium sp. NPDC049525]|uniref:non-homologous end joining protein Ku n=1 Tax=Dactylosporangium sp. NPDC049525 TaxID=3154730 RepID=UPI0034336046